VCHVDEIALSDDDVANPIARAWLRSAFRTTKLERKHSRFPVPSRNGKGELKLREKRFTALESIMLGFRLAGCAALTLLLTACSDANAPKIYVASWLGQTIKAYNAAGVQTNPTITLPHELEAMVVDSSGKLYVAEPDATTKTQSIVSYDAAGLAARPIITGLRCVSGIALDAGGKLYVENGCDGTVTVYSTTGVQTGAAITGLGTPQGIAVDAAGKIYVFNFDDNTLTTYTAGGVKTTPSIAGLSGLFAVDASGKIYAAGTDGTLEVYKADGSQIPSIAMPKGSEVLDAAIDGAGKIYVLSSVTGSNQSTLTTYNPDGTPSTPTISALPGTSAVKIDRSSLGTSTPMIAVR
jgi:sugar lactone lactonase YvrE